MAKYSNVVQYDIKTTLDASGITKLQSELSKVQNTINSLKGKKGLKLGLDIDELEMYRNEIEQLSRVLNTTFNTRTGMLDLNKFNTALKNGTINAERLGAAFNVAGNNGKIAFNSLVTSITTLNKNAITANSTLTKIANTFSNTVRWGITASIFQEMMSSVQSAVSYMKDLDESLTNIQMVTNSSKEDMRELAQYANNAAQALGSTTTDYTNAVKVFVQEGFSEKESKQYANLSTKLANVSEQSTAVTSDQITAYRNAFQLDYQQTVEAMDKVANVANNTASNVNELMTASQRAASVAQAVGSSQDSFLAAIATIESVTRQSAEEIGNGLKTIYQRFADIKTGKTAEDGVDYGQYAKALQSVGVDVLDAAGQFKGMDQILKELQEVWSSLDDTMKIAVGEKVAGKFQYNRFAALMNNPEYYQKALGATQNASGMMDQMNEYYMEGIEGRLNTLQAAGEQIMSTLFDQDTIEPIIGAATDLLNIINSIINSVGGGLPVFTALVAAITKIFNTQIGEQAARIATNISTIMQGSQNAKQMETTLNGLQAAGITTNTDTYKYAKQSAGLMSGLNSNTQQAWSETVAKSAEIEEQMLLAENKYNETIGLANSKLEARYKISSHIKDIEASQNSVIKEEAIALEQIKEILSQTVVLDEENFSIDQNLLKQKVAIAKLLAEGKDLTYQEVIAESEKVDLLGADLGITESILQAERERAQAQQQHSAQLKVQEQFNERMNMEKRAQGVANWVSGLTSVLFLYQSISSLIETLNDDSLSTGEKMKAAFSGLITMLPMALMAYQSFVAAKAADVGVTTILTGAIGGLTTAVRALGLAIASLPIIGQIAVAITALIVAITGLVTIVDEFILKTNAANQEYKKQSELLKDLQSSYEELSSSVQGLKQSIESLEQRQDALSKLKEGTVEWKEAVLALNEQILSLLETYPKLAEYINNENGVLSISKEGLETIYNEQLKKVQIAQNMVTAQQIQTRQSASNLALEDFRNDHRWFSGGAGINESLLKETVNNINDGSWTIKEACEQLGLNVEDNGADLLQLSETIKSNNVAIENLNDTMNNSLNYKNFASDIDVNTLYDKIYNDLGSKYSGVFGPITSDSVANSTEFKNLVAKSLQLDEGSVISLKQKDLFSSDWTVTTKDGSPKTYDQETLRKLITDYQVTIDQANEAFEKNKEIYEALGAKWNEETQNFEGGFQLNEQQAQLIKDYQSNKEIQVGDQLIGFADYMANQGYNSIDKFCKALADSEGKLFEFGENLSNIQTATSLSDLEYEKSKQEEQGPLTSEQQTNYDTKLNELTEQAAEAYDIDLEDIIDQAKAFREELNLTEGAARDLAIQNQRMTRGIDALYNGWEKWSDILQNSNHAAKDYIDASQEATKAIADLVGASDDLELSNEFFESAENLEDIALAAEGDIEAINRLGVAVGKDLIEAMEAVSREASGLDFSDADTEQAYTNMVNQFYDAKSTVMAGLDELQAQINNLGIGENVYSILGGEEWVNALNTMAEQTHMSVDQMNSLLNSIGVQADVTVKHVPTQIEQPEYITEESVETLPSAPGEPTRYRKTSRTWVNRYVPMQGYIDVAQINTGDSIGTPPSITYVGNGPVSRSSTPAGRSKGGGGGGKSPKSGSGGSGKDTKPKDKDKTEWDYLTDITNDLDRAAAVIEKLSKLEDRLYGSSRVSQIKKLQKEYKNYIGLLEQEVKLAENHAQLLRSNAYDENGNLTINGYGYRAGVGSLQFDAQNNLENGKEIEARLVDRVNAAIDDYNAHRNADDASYYEERVSLAQKDHEGFLKALSEYESTLGKIEDGQSQIQDYKEKIQDATDEIVDAIQDGIEDVLEAIDNQRDFNKMYRDWMQGGSGYSHLGNQHRYYTEGLEGLLSPGQNGVSIFDMQLQSLQDRIEDFKNVFDGDSQNADDEKLSEQAAFENLQEATKNIVGSLEKAIDYYDSLLETIQDASDKMDELIDDRLDEFNNLEDYLDTRLDQLKLLFGDKSYEQQAQLYNEKIAVNMEKMVSINTAIEAKQATVKALEGLEESGKELSTEERKELKDARNKVTSLQKEQLDTESQLLQDIANRLGNQVNAELDTMVNKIFGGEDIDWLTQQWELSTRLSEQYLDDYNRAFELQKLQIKYQELLNDTQATSAMAQQRISAQMTQQLKYLREKNHLSEYDVEYAEKKLEILQRELALEDARNNKSQMRLQRNAAGNYDFVYAADEDAINDAKMALLNAQQEAYNLSKKIYKEIYDGALKLSKELKQMVFDIATDASLTTEQQAERIKWIMENTSEYLGNASVELGEVSVNLYNDIADAEQLIAEENLGNLANTFEIMRAQSKSTQDSIGQDLSDGKNNFDGILNESSNSAKGTIEKIEQGVIDSSGNISENISEVTSNIDENFKLSASNALESTNTIDAIFKEAFNKIAGEDDSSYLNQYKNKTTEVLKQAGEEYGTFTEQSIDHATEQFELLRQATQDWNDDLDTLKQMIEDNTDEIKDWKTEIGLAMEASKNFITESNNLQAAFGKIGAMATIAGGMLDIFGEAAYGAGSAVDTMSHDIEGAYYSIRDAAEAAAQAYNDMAWAASNAARQADNARIAADNARRALSAAGIVNNIGSGITTVVNSAFSSLNNLFKGGSKKVSYDTNYLWDGFTYSQWDTGGYTGTWTDQGIDDKSGKWAILHQKELVLNADDTKNMLSAVEVVRDIMSNINSLPSLGKITTQNNLTDTIEQRVEINATFPGVTEAIQIKQALEQIADNAYQVANKYKY